MSDVLVQALHNNVIIKEATKVVEENTTSSLKIGKVQSVGQGLQEAGGTRKKLSVKKEDVVLFVSTLGLEMCIGTTPVFIVPETEIIAIIR